MTHNALSRGVEFGEGGEKRGGKLGGDVAVHFVVGGVGGVCGVNVESGAGAEVPGFVFAGDVEASCT